MHSIFRWSNEEDVLLHVWNEEQWLPLERRRECVSGSALLSHKVHFKDLVLLTEDDGVLLVFVIRVFEMVVHANLCEGWHIFNNHSRMLLKFVCTFDFLKDEKLISFLLVHDQYLSTDDT